MNKEMRDLLNRSYKGDEVIKYIESLEDKLNKIKMTILNQTTTFCKECSSVEHCPEDECVLYRIEQIVENGTE